MRFLVIIALSIMITGCMVGPNFHSPARPNVPRFTEKPLAKKTVATPSAGKAGKSQHFLTRRDVPAEWWYLFHSKQLNALINRGLANSPNLSAAYASLRQAQEILNAQIGNSLFPAFGGQFNASRQNVSALSAGTSSAASSASASTGSTSASGLTSGTGLQSSIFNLFNTSVNVSYTLDIFGGARREIEALRAQVDYQQFELIAAYLTLTSNIVTTTITTASLEAQIEATRALIRAQGGQLSILRKQFQLGGISSENVLTQETLVYQTRATLPPLEKSLSQARHALSVLIGAYPYEPLPVIHLESLNLPAKLPVSLPSNLVRQRPDVRASEALLHYASAQIGVATANLFPKFSITGNDGWTSTMLSTLIRPSHKAWSIAGQVVQPIFHGGALFASRRAAIAAYDLAFAQYRQTVLAAFQNVADTLRALETDARTLRAQKIAELSAGKSLRLSREQYRLGGVNYLSLLTAQQQYQMSRISRIQAQAARYADTAALFQALGGGWWHKEWCVKECL